MQLYKTVYEMNLEILHPHFADFFAAQKFTSMPIKTIDNKQVNKTKANEIPTKTFPNPNAHRMLRDFNEKQRTIYSETIVEYKDENGQTLLYLFPDGSVFKTQDIVLTGESRRDLIMETQARRRALRGIKSR